MITQPQAPTEQPTSLALDNACAVTGFMTGEDFLAMVIDSITEGYKKEKPWNSGITRYGLMKSVVEVFEG
jgi:hypothetical protein